MILASKTNAILKILYTVFSGFRNEAVIQKVVTTLEAFIVTKGIIIKGFSYM